MSLYLGIDIGTSGVRTSVIDSRGHLVAHASVSMEAPIKAMQDAELWWVATSDCLRKQSDELQSNTPYSFTDIQSLAIDGTSGTLVLVDADLKPVTKGYMYNSANFDAQAIRILEVSPPESLGRGAGSALARLLFLQEQQGARRARFALHQADFVAARLMGASQRCFSDETNVLKMGYDLQQRSWPDWFADCGVRPELLPAVEPVGAVFQNVGQHAVQEFGFSPETNVIAGTTDSNAAFLASGACNEGEGVTSLGTTLAIKFLSSESISDPSRGVYSHRIKNMWLPGGASNSGGGVLLNYFSAQQMTEMQSMLDPDSPLGLEYYPLSQAGERFPIADPTLAPRMLPRPASDIHFFQAILEGISEIERLGYSALADLGAPPLTKVFTAGGGAANEPWRRIRERILGVPVVKALSSDASYGTARIAAGLI